MVLSDPAWQPEDYTSALVRTAEAINPFNIRTYPRTLPGFRARGGKLITYHGGQDQQLTQFGTERFVERMARGDGRLGDYNRYFPILGMFHCNAGPGAWVLDQGGNAAAAGIGFDAESNVLAAAVAWVEEGRAGRPRCYEGPSSWMMRRPRVLTFSATTAPGLGSRHSWAAITRSLKAGGVSSRVEQVPAHWVRRDFDISHSIYILASTAGASYRNVPGHKVLARSGASRTTQVSARGPCL